MQAIQFTSTRSALKHGASKQVGIEQAIVDGMPRDGGLYVPTALPSLPSRVFDLSPLDYVDLAYLVLEPFFPGWENKGSEAEDGALKRILRRAYEGRSPSKDRPELGTIPYFSLPEITPVVSLEGLIDPQGSGIKIFLLELFHGKTCAFKDLALSVLGGFLRESLDRLGKKEPVLVLTATSGDTGSAALEGLAGIPGIDVAVLYPEGGTSEIQRLQMTTTGLDGRFVAGIRGDFDAAQRAVKAIFMANAEGRGPLARAFLSSANSINIGRLLPQIVYYVAAWRNLAARNALGEGRLMNVAVPTGNFGDILAAKYAKEMGLPIDRLICASNTNKVLADFFATGVYDRRRALVKTDSPSMDILVSSNLERLLYMASGKDPERVGNLMADLAGQGWFEINETEKEYMSDFAGGWCSDYSASLTIASTWESCSVLVDPHTATAIEVAMRVSSSLDNSAPVLVAGTASPFKFPKACLEAIDPSSELRSEISDLVHAKRLSEIVGKDIPKSIANLGEDRVVHDSILGLEEVEAALGNFALATGAIHP
jgi:threonine synthase